MRPLLWMTLILGVTESIKIRGTPLRSEFSVNVNVKPGHDAFRNRPSNRDSGVIVSQFARNGKYQENNIHDRFHGFLIRDTNQFVHDKIAVDVPIPNLMNGQLMNLPVPNLQDSHQQSTDYDITTISPTDNKLEYSQPVSNNSTALLSGHEESSSQVDPTVLDHNVPNSPTASFLSSLEQRLLPSKGLIGYNKHRIYNIYSTYTNKLSTPDVSEDVSSLDDYTFESSENDNAKYKVVTPVAQPIHSHNDNQDDTHLDIFSYQLATAMPRNDEDVKSEDNNDSIEFEFVAPQNVVLQQHQSKDLNNYKSYHFATAIPRFDLPSTPENKEVVESISNNFIKPKLPVSLSTMPISMRSENYNSQEVPKTVMPNKMYNVNVKKPLLEERSTTVTSTIKSTTETSVTTEEFNFEELKDIDVLTSMLKEEKETCREGMTWEVIPCSRHFFKCEKGERLPAFCDEGRYVYSRKANKCIPRIQADECFKIAKEAKSTTTLSPRPVTNKKVSDSEITNITTTPKSSCGNRADGFYRHQSNCSRIIQCFGGEEFEYPPCPNNLAFDESTGLCNYRQKIEGCSFLNITTSSDTLPIIKVDALLQQNSSSIFSEIKENINLVNSTAERIICDHGSHSPNPSDCSSFYRCVWNQRVLMHCPQGTMFNPKLAVCDYPHNVPQCNRIKTI